MYCFFDEGQKREFINISPGEYFISAKGMCVYTLVGSGFAVALYDPFLKIGGMIHMIMPNFYSLKETSSEKFVLSGLEEFINDFLENGSDKINLEAKLLGGSVFCEEDKAAVNNNLTFIEDYLDGEKIKIKNSSTGGDEVRKVFYYPESFNVRIKKIEYPDSVLEKQNRDYRVRIKSELLSRKKRVSIFDRFR